MSKINKLLDTLEAAVIHHSQYQPTISEGDVGWHIVHSCLVINSVCTAVLTSDPSTFVKKFSLKAYLVLLFNSFPRGKVKAPSFTVPPEQLSSDTILQHIQDARKSVEALTKASQNQYFKHPMFGNINTAGTFKFLSVHTYHHWKIIRDILKK